MAIKYSALNLVPIREGEDEQTAINDMVNLAQHLDELSYERYWIAEHHNAPNLVSSATALLIQHTLEHTKHIRVGSGGIMLPNHAPLIVAEQFGTMANIISKSCRFRIRTCTWNRYDDRKCIKTRST